MPKTLKLSENSMSHVTDRGLYEPDSITGRDFYITAKAFAYAIETIESLPERWQEYSDCLDMKAIFEARFSKQMREIVTESARLHLFQEGGFHVGPSAI
jgi:hypothetical protein